MTHGFVRTVVYAQNRWPEGVVYPYYQAISIPASTLEHDYTRIIS